MSLAPKQSDESKIRRYKFTEAEDMALLNLVHRFGTRAWPTIASFLNGRNARQCRDRWNHYLAPSNTNDEWTAEEDDIIIRNLKQVGKQWTYIASLLPGRTSVGVRNRSCKLSRRPDADPVIKSLLQDEYKKKKSPHNVSAHPTPVPDAGDNEQQKIVLPPCLDLLQMVPGVSSFINPIEV